MMFSDSWRESADLNTKLGESLQLLSDENPLLSPSTSIWKKIKICSLSCLSYSFGSIPERMVKIFQSKDLPNTCIQPNRRWFGNTRVVNQKELEFFLEELQNRMSNGYNVIL